MRRMVTSFEMMQEFLRIMSCEHSVTVMRTVGVSTIEDIREISLLGQKNISITFSNLSLSKAVDNLKCKEFYDLFYYRFYQAIQTSLVSH